MNTQLSQQQTLERVAEDIQAIRQHPHINSIQKINNFTYKLVYHPIQLRCAYRSNSYVLQLILPTTYPKNPPSINFIEQVYHLNIGYNSGEVRMSIMEDDWSPFLSLTSLIESLDHILQEPDQLYALDEDVLDLFQNERQQYDCKVIQSLALADVVDCQSAEKRISGKGSPLNRNKQDKSLSPKKDKAQNLVKNLRQSMEIAEENELIQLVSCEQIQNTAGQSGYPTMVRTQSRQQIIPKKVKKDYRNQNGNIKSKGQQILFVTTNSIQVEQQKSNEFGNDKNSANNKKSILQKNQTSKLLDGKDTKNKTLQQINQTISLFIAELNQIQEQLNSTKNQGIKILLKQRQENQLNTLRELMELSQDAKKKIIKKLKEQVSRI